MKRCSVCQSVYADDSLRFCLQDGAALESVTSSPDDERTWVLPKVTSDSSNPPPTEFLDPAQLRPTPPTVPYRPRDTKPITATPLTPQPTGRSTASIVGLTILATLALLALGGGGAWLLLRDTQNSTGNVNTEQARDNQNNAPPNGNPRPPARSTPSVSPTPASIATPAAPPSATPATTAAVEEAAVRSALDRWLASFRARDLDAYMARYASVLEAYYLSRNVSVERVRGDKARAFAKYTSIEVWLSNVRVSVDASGQRAVATFNKSWRFTGPGVSPFTGSGLNRFTFSKLGGGWYIIGEEDISS